MSSTLTGDVERVTFENEETSFRVIRVAVEGQPAPVVVVGTFQAVGPGTRIRASGAYVRDAKHGRQFRVEALVPVEPETLQGIERYLGSGLITGIGPGFAKRIVTHFGLDTLKVLDEKPERLREISGLGARRIEQIKERWSSQRALGSVMMLLQTHGASPSLAGRIVERYGDKAAAVVQRSPYRLALEVRGVGFKTADRIARSLGISGDHPERAQAGVMHVLGQLSDQGHVSIPRQELIEASGEMLQIAREHVDAAVDALWGQERVVVEDSRVVLARLHRAEVNTARTLERLMLSPGEELLGTEPAIAKFEASVGVQLADEQRAAILAVAQHKVVVITGGPGVGKTTIVRCILEVFDRARLTVRLAAPTGRAAKRLSESTGRLATTLHRLLEYDPRARAFNRDLERPIDAQAVVVDEASMIDIQLAESLLSAVPTSARLVLVGDVDQLPSVGPGAFLRDVIASQVVPTRRLDRIFRQTHQSGIVDSAHSILKGEMPELTTPDTDSADFFVIQRKDPEAARGVIVELVTKRIPARFGHHPRDQIQVLSPMHRGAVGTSALNEELQRRLNPSGAMLERRGQSFRVGDKVMQTKNDYDKDVFNGDIGVVRGVDVADKSLRVQFDERIVEYQESELDALVLAYAISIHKSQGSEYPAVVIPLLTQHFVMLSRNLLYTAVTRARRLCVLVADPRALKLALAETRKEERLTTLRERLQSAMDA